MRLYRLGDEGAAVLIVSTELDEVFALADRIAMMFEGRIVGLVEASETDRNEGECQPAHPACPDQENPGHSDEREDDEAHRDGGRRGRREGIRVDAEVECPRHSGEGDQCGDEEGNEQHGSIIARRRVQAFGRDHFGGNGGPWSGSQVPISVHPSATRRNSTTAA